MDGSESGSGRGRGRPEFEPTEEMRERVAIAAGGGMSHERIALALGICRATLEKHFDAELSIGGYTRRLEVLNALFKSAISGNVAASKAYLAHEPELAAPPESAGADASKPLPVEQPLPEGKKERANLEAKTAQDGTGWQGILPDHRNPPAPPKLSIVKPKTAAGS